MKSARYADTENTQPYDNQYIIETLTFIYEYFFIIFQSEYDATTRDEATALHQMGAFVFTVGLGSWLSIANVRQVATLPSWYGGLDDWREGLALPGFMTTATAGKN